MARRSEEEPRPKIRWVRFSVWLVAGVLVMSGTLMAWHRTEEFLIKDDRFRLPEPDQLGERSPNLVVEGIKHASTSQIRHVFAEDLGRSLYLVPIQRRRAQLLQIDWVQEATVSKVWPNSLRVLIRERVPVAFVRLPASHRDGSSRLALIDIDGCILRPRVPAQFTLPVITGVTEADPVQDRRTRVRRVMTMLNDVGRLASKMSEIDASDPNDLVVAEQVNSTVVDLMLGDENYAERLQNFLDNYQQIKQKRPDAKTIDLRVDGTITVVGDKHGG
jgi:cell division protein FtsQ